jgi:hypothetical protein
LLVSAGFILLADPLSAQLKLGDTSTTASGNVQPGYTANYGSSVPSTHGWELSGMGTVNGSYHSPGFLSYSVSPYLNESRDNSDYRSVSNSSGIAADVNIFNGSHYPGSFNLSKNWDAEGTYNLPGVANYVTHGNSTNVGVGWGEAIPDMPSLSAQYQRGTNDYSLYGSDSTGSSDYNNFNLNSSYHIAEFGLGAFYTLGDNHSNIPEIVSGQPASTIDSKNQTYGFTLFHPLPLRGSASASATESIFDASYLGFSTNQHVGLFNASAALQPAKTVSVSSSINYSDNLQGQVLSQILNTSGVADNSTSNSSNSVDLISQVNFHADATMQATLSYEHRAQTYLGTNYVENTYGGGATYYHKVFKGNFNLAAYVTGSVQDGGGGSSLGANISQNYTGVYHKWDLSEGFTYAQNNQTLLVAYTTSYFNFNGNAHRRMGKLLLSLGGSGGRTGFSNQQGYASTNQNYYGNVTYRNFLTGSGSYSKGTGQALLSGSGYQPSPLPYGLYSLYGGNSYSFSVSSTPRKGLILSTAYAKSDVNSSSANPSGTPTLSSNNNTLLSSQVDYRVRKLNFISGYTRVDQGFSSSSVKAESLSSFYIGVSRWFKFF